MAGKFEPKTPVVLNPPKDTPIPLSELSAANGTIIMSMNSSLELMYNQV